MSPALGERLHKIGEVAEAVGVTPRTIRYYEELGLLGPGTARPKGGHRLYGEDDIARLRELISLRDLLGLSLEELTSVAEDRKAQDCLRSRWESSTDDAERARIVRTAIPHVERQLELVGSRRRRLEEFAAELTAKLERLHRRLEELEAPHSRT
jgi:MerR family transcriptional regulator, repressor of the yfmOP operon